MRVVLIITLVIIAILAFLLWPKQSIAPVKVENKETTSTTDLSITGETQQMGSLTLKSPAFENNSSIPQKYTCDGENINPPLEIDNIPSSAESLVLIMDDPDAPAGTWVHWTIWNIPAKTQQLDENSKLEGIEGMTSFGKPGYGGPCPPPASPNRGESGTHHYIFRLYALDTTLDLPSSTSKNNLEKAMEGHTLEKTELVGLYR